MIGPDSTLAATVTVSLFAPTVERLTKIGIVVIPPGRAAGIVPTVTEPITDGDATVAFAEGAARIVRPAEANAIDATEAIRFRNVFLDIDFLSVVVKKAFFSTAWQRAELFAS